MSKPKTETVFGLVAGVLFVAALVGYCFFAINISNSWDQREAAWNANPTNPVNICMSKGGMPITSSWDGSLERCEFAPSKDAAK